LRGTPEQQLMVVIHLTDTKHTGEKFANVVIDPHQVFWHVGKKEDLARIPVSIPKARALLCEDLNENKFTKFVINVLKESGVELPESDLFIIVERLNREDLHGAYTELQKFIHLIQANKGSYTERDLRWIGGGQHHTVIDLFNAFVAKQDPLPILFDLEKQDVAPLQILGFFFDNIERLILLKVFKSKGGSVNDFAAKFKLHPYFTMKFDQATSTIPPQDVFRWHQRLCSMDVTLKYAGVSGYTIWQSFFLEESRDVGFAQQQ